MNEEDQIKCAICGAQPVVTLFKPMCRSCRQFQIASTQQNPTLEGLEERFDKQFGKAGSEMDSDSIGRSAGCDDCTTNIELREEHKDFIRTLITAAKEEGYVIRAREETNSKVYPIGHVLEREQEIANAIAAAERKAYERVIDDIDPLEIEELQSEAIEEWKQQLRAKFLNQGEET